MTLHFRIGEVDAASVLVRKHHYSERWPANVQVVGTWHADGGLFGDRGEALAACAFSIPPTRWSVELWELCRLVRHPNVKLSLTGLIAATCDFIRSRKLMDLLVSYADATQKHHGGVYQAASWNYNGQRKAARDGLFIDGVWFPCRNANHKFGTNSPEKLRAILPDAKIEEHIDLGKHLYWRALSKSGERKAAHLGLKRQAYPKPKQEAAAA